MTTTDRLARIRARCVELLDLASKRTPGKWELGDENNQHYEICIGDSVLSIDRQDRYGMHMAYSREEMIANGHFIMECAGAAEAAWKATIAAIDGLLAIIGSDISADPYEACNHHEEANEAIDAIIAEWEGLV